MLTLDGSRDQQGDQVLRTALTLSILTGQDFEVSNVRRGRPNPGLGTQQLYLLRALLSTTDAKVDGLTPGATMLRFRPGPRRSGRVHIEFGRVGPISVALQTLIPIIMFGREAITCTINGSTDVPGDMTLDWWEHVLLPFVRPYVKEIALQVLSRGYYPRGGGQVCLHCVPGEGAGGALPPNQPLPPLEITARGGGGSVHVISRAVIPLRPHRVAERQAGAFFKHLGVKEPDVQIHYMGNTDVGASITAWVEYEQTRLGVCAVAEPGRTPDDAGRTAAEILHREMISDATVDLRAAETLMPWIALLGGSLRVSRMTDTMRTILTVIEQFLPGLLTVHDKEIRGSGRLYLTAPTSPRANHRTGQLAR